MCCEIFFITVTFVSFSSPLFQHNSLPKFSFHFEFEHTTQIHNNTWMNLMLNFDISSLSFLYFLSRPLVIYRFFFFFFFDSLFFVFLSRMNIKINFIFSDRGRNGSKRGITTTNSDADCLLCH